MTSPTSSISHRKRPFTESQSETIPEPKELKTDSAPSETQDLQESLRKLAEVTARAKIAADNLNKENDRMLKEVTVTPRSAFSPLAIPTPMRPVSAQAPLNGRVEQLESQFTQIVQNQNTTNSLLENLLARNNQPKLKLTIPVQGLAPQAATSSTAYPTPPLDPYAEGKDLFEKKRFFEAIEILKKLPNVHPDFQAAQCLIGTCYYERGYECWFNGNQLDAIKWYKKVPSCHSVYGKAMYKMGEIHYQIGQSYYEQGDHPKAIEHFSQVFYGPYGQPFFEDAQYKIGEYHYSHHKFHEALFPLGRVTQNHPKFIYAQIAYGVCLSQLGRYDEAIQHFSEIQKIDFNNPIAWYYLGYCFYKQGHYAFALGNLLSVPQSHPLYNDAQNLIRIIQPQKPIYWRNQF